MTTSRSTAESATRILIVEDDRVVLALLARGLEERGYEVFRAASGEEAVLSVGKVLPHLVLMDICLPGISGTEAAQQITSRMNIPIVFLSALDTDEVVRQAIAAGSLSYLVKPVSINQLVPAIENALERARDIAGLRSSAEHLASAVTQDRDISVAVGKLMERHGVSSGDAFEILRTHARNTRRKTSDVARAVIAGSLQLQPAGGNN